MTVSGSARVRRHRQIRATAGLVELRVWVIAEEKEKALKRLKPFEDRAKAAIPTARRGPQPGSRKTNGAASAPTNGTGGE